MKFIKNTLKVVGKIALLALAGGVMATVFLMSCEPAKAAEANRVDTTAIDGWCGGYYDGNVRMVGGWVDSTSEEEIFIADETGELWTVTNIQIDENAFLLLWIADSNTPNDKTDDIILKVWQECH